MKSPKDHSYPRGVAISGALLVDVSEAAHEVGLEYPVAVTANLARLLRPTEYLKTLGVSFEERTTMLLSLVRQSLTPGSAQAAGGHEGGKLMIPFIITRGPLIKEELISVEVVLGEGDDGKGAITLFSLEPPLEAA